MPDKHAVCFAIEPIHIIHSYEQLRFGQQKINFLKKVFCREKMRKIPANALPRLPKQAGQCCRKE
jgi:hypothetical protein